MGGLCELEHHLRVQAINASDIDALIFQAPGGGPLRRSHFRSRVWVPACTRAGLVGVGFHDLRRTNATILVALGTSIRDAPELLGHDDPRMLLGVYAQATETGKRAAVDGVRAALEPTDSRQRTTSNDGGCAMNVPWPPLPAPARCDRSAVAPATPSLQRVEVRGIEPLASTVRLLRSAN